MAEWRRQLFRLLFLALFFFSGIILGQVFSRHVPDAAGDELSRYLTDFLKVEQEDPASRTALSAALLYFRYPLSAFLLGFASIGVLLLPLLTGAFGFFLSFPSAASRRLSALMEFCWPWQCSASAAR